MSHLSVEYLNLEIPEPDRKWSLVRQVNPGEDITFNNFKLERDPLGGERLVGMALMRASCAQNGQTSGIVRIAENESGTTAETWDLLFNPPTPVLEVILGPNESHALFGSIEDISNRGMLRFTHFTS